MSNYSIELNNVRKDADFTRSPLKTTSPVVETFSAMVSGKEIGNIKNSDKASKWIMTQSTKAANGDPVAAAELNSVRRLVMQPILLEEIKLLSIFGNYQALSWEDSAEVEVPEFANVQGNIQAPGQDVTFPVIRKKRVPVPTVTVSGGYSVDYRKAALGDMTMENELQNQVRVQIRNKAAKYIIDTVYVGVKNASGVKYFFEGSGLTKTGVDGVLTNVRRFGKPTVIGDYALVSQFNGFAGYQGVTPTVTGISEAIMNEMHQTGLIGMYMGAILSEMPNPYDLTSLTADGTNFNTLLPQGLGFIVPASSGASPIYNITRGGLTSCQGLDVTTGQQVQRFDLEVGTLLVPGQEYKVALIHDKNLDDLAG